MRLLLIVTALAALTVVHSIHGTSPHSLRPQPVTVPYGASLPKPPTTVPTVPAAVAVDPAAMQLTEVILFSNCGTNIAIEWVSSNLKGDTDTKIAGRWSQDDSNSQDVYRKAMEYYTPMIGDAYATVNVFRVELNTECSKV